MTDRAPDLALIAEFNRALPDPALVVDHAGVVLAANERAAAILDAPPVGRHFTVSLRAPAVLQAVNDALVQHVASRVQYVTRAFTQQTFDVYVSPLRLPQGFAALIILRDLTREQQVERMRADFVANASHELRTPLSSLAGFIETMQGAAKSDAVAREKFLALMKAQADRMGRLIDDLLSLSRIEISEHVRPTERADLTAIANQVRDVLAPAAKAAGCEIRIKMPPSLVIIGDADQLAQVIQNLTENAIRYAGAGKFIDLEGEQRGRETVFTVRDYGPGIDRRHVPRLTERFYRVNVQDSSSRGGTGLGLAIVKHIANRHRGKLVIESEPGKGSAFSVHFPNME